MCTLGNPRLSYGHCPSLRHVKVIADSGHFVGKGSTSFWNDVVSKENGYV